jgi:hypothetical protein
MTDNIVQLPTSTLDDTITAFGSEKNLSRRR